MKNLFFLFTFFFFTLSYTNMSAQDIYVTKDEAPTLLEIEASDILSSLDRTTVEYKISKYYIQRVSTRLESTATIGEILSTSREDVELEFPVGYESQIDKIQTDITNALKK